MIFEHKETKKHALWITPYDESWKNTDDPDIYHICSPADIPMDKCVYSKLHIPIEIYKGQGSKGLFYYFQAFLQDDEDFKPDAGFWMLFIESGFPNGIIE